MRADLATEREDCAEVDLEHLVPVVVGEEVRRVTALNTTTVEQDVDLVAVFEDLRNESGD